MAKRDLAARTNLLWRVRSFLMWLLAEHAQGDRTYYPVEW